MTKIDQAIEDIKKRQKMHAEGSARWKEMGLTVYANRSDAMAKEDAEIIKLLRMKRAKQ